MPAPKLEDQIIHDWPLDHWRDVTVVVGVSGGPDSVALLRALKRLAPTEPARLVVAHFDHAWRRESADDADFVRQLGREWNLPVEVGRAAAPGQPMPGAGREDSARRERFEFFAAVGRKCGARYLALGHTNNDHVETVLHRILRGTGPAGLVGIPLQRPWYHGAAVVHPLRNVSRSEVLQYLAQLKQPYLVDPTNSDPSLTRNRIRHDLLPKLRAEYNPQVDGALERLAIWAEQYREWMHVAIEQLAEVAVGQQADGSVLLAPATLRNQPALALTELFRWIWSKQGWPQRSMSSAAWNRLAEFVTSDLRRLELPDGVTAERAAEGIVLRRIAGE